MDIVLLYFSTFLNPSGFYGYNLTLQEDNDYHQYVWNEMCFQINAPVCHIFYLYTLNGLLKFYEDILKYSYPFLIISGSASALDKRRQCLLRAFQFLFYYSKCTKLSLGQLYGQGEARWHRRC